MLFKKELQLHGNDLRENHDPAWNQSVDKQNCDA